MDRKGVTLVELLAAIVIMAIVVSLVSMLLNTMNDANVQITEEARANIEATKLIANLEDYFDDFSPTDYRECEVGNCVVLEKDFEYIYSQLETTVILVVNDPVSELMIIFNENQLVIDDLVYELYYFSFNEDFLISTSINDKSIITITIEFALVSETNIYSFVMAYSYNQLVIPES
jgi:prepilin-type N-terminal cleavage/methylation domain-containing protein